MISELFSVSTKGEAIFHKRYRFDLIDNAVEAFKKKLQDAHPHTIKPHWSQDGINYYHVKRNNVYLIAASKTIQPLLIIEILTKFYQIIKDFCGTFNEDSLKANIILVYELLDDFIDHGHVQLSSTEKLKPYIQSDPITVRATRAHQMTSGLFGVEYRAPVAPESADKPLVRSQADQENRRDEIFLDVVERINVVMECNNEISRFDLNGRVNMKCFLSVGGAPVIHIALNDDLQLGKESSYGIQLDEYSLHESIDKETFSEKQELVLSPPQGEFTAMTYSLSDRTQAPPIRFLLTSKENSSRQAEISVKLRSNVPDSAEIINFSARITLPKTVDNVTMLTKGPQQTLDYVQRGSYVSWQVKRLRGDVGTRAGFTIHYTRRTDGGRALKPEPTPVHLDFEISGHVTSGVAVKYLKLNEPNGCAIKPCRWIRYITVPDSYIVHVDWI